MGNYLLKRLIIMVGMIIAITIVSFIIIQLPPGNFVTVYISALRATGQQVNEAEIARLMAMYGLDRPVYVQFFIWVRGFFNGSMGYSFAFNKPVLELVIPALRISAIIALIVFVVLISLQIIIGYYAARKKNTALDYIISFVGTVGMSVPSFVVALFALWIAYLLTGRSFAGLFSREFLMEPFSFAKFLNGLQHLIIPVCVVAFCGLFRYKNIRANMLDEINKPYVVTARAKGLDENKLMIKYPLRMAMIPIIGNIGMMLAALISGEAIIGIVLNLPTLGPLMLSALRAQDMYLAGSILLIQSIMILIGIFVSDICLVLIDPRVRLDK